MTPNYDDLIKIANMKMPFGKFFTDSFTTTLNIYSKVGLVTLVGLVSKNGILIVQFANQLQRQGHDKLAAVAQAMNVTHPPAGMESRRKPSSAARKRTASKTARGADHRALLLATCVGEWRTRQPACPGQIVRSRADVDRGRAPRVPRVLAARGGRQPTEALRLGVQRSDPSIAVMLEHCTHRSIERFTAEWATRT